MEGGTGCPFPERRERGLVSGQKCRHAIHTGPFTGARVSITESMTSSPRFHSEEEEKENGCDFAKAVRVFPIFTQGRREEALNYAAKFTRGSPLKLILQT